MSEATCKSGMSDKEKSMLFWASFLSLTAAGVGFVFRVMIPTLWQNEFSISSAEVGGLTGAALWPIAITMIIFSLLVDKIGYKVSMFFAFALQALSVVLTVTATDVNLMWWACFAAGLGHGIVGVREWRAIVAYVGSVGLFICANWTLLARSTPCFHNSREARFTKHVRESNVHEVDDFSLGL